MFQYNNVQSDDPETKHNLDIVIEERVCISSLSS